MSEWIPSSTGEDGSTPVPRDPPDQQATDESDTWDLNVSKADEGDSGKAAEVPDTDEGGTARRGESRPLESHPEKPVPEEPSG